MSYPVYYVPAGDVLPIFFSSYGKTNGESITLTGLAVTDIEIYRDGGATQRASDAGYTLLDTDGIDFDGITGIHGFSIDTGDNTDAGFYTTGAWFHVIVSAVTVDSQTVNFVAAAFRLMSAESAAGVPKADVSHFGGSAGTFSGGRAEVNTSHAAGTAWNSGAIGAATLASDTIAAAKIATGAITAAKFAAGAIDAAAVADGAIDRATFAADTGLQTIRSNTAQAGAATTITLDASASATNDIYNGSFILITGSTGAGQGRFITDYDGTTKVATVDPAWATNPSATSTFAILPGGIQDVAAAVWNAARASYTTAGTFGQGVASVQGSMTGNVAGSVGSVSASVSVGDIEPSPLAEIRTEAAGALADIHLDHFIQSADPGSIVADSSLLAKLTSKSATPAFTSYNNTTDSLEAIRDKETDIETDTQDLQSRTPAALVSGRMDSSVGAMANDTVTATAIAANAIGASELAADAATEIANAVFAKSFAATLGSYTFEQLLVIAMAALAGKSSGQATATNVFRDLGDGQNVISATTDSDGNRTAVTLNP